MDTPADAEETTIFQIECQRCGHQWWPRALGWPARCPRCWDPRYDVPLDPARRRAKKRKLAPRRPAP